MSSDILTADQAIRAAVQAATTTIKETLGVHYTLENALDVVIMLSVEHITQCATKDDQVTESVLITEFIESVACIAEARLDAIEIDKKPKRPKLKSVPPQAERP
ncbi:MAG: hypothetical protein BVN35_00155 [Proteobacteria bacterium ST_bin11]|jgi:hypothetical protein|nr:MAG: hypothetical protein BVN35_00155 [Proteobacteria bacterium ST_bin11]